MDSNKVKKYLELQEEVEKTKAEMEILKAEIVDAMNKEGINKFTTEDGTAISSVVMKETVKYNDEPAMISWLRTNGMDNFIVTKVNTTAFNKQLKTSQTLNESLNKYFTKNISYSLSVKRAS